MSNRFENKNLRTPYYLMDIGLIRKNLEILREVSEQARCKILLAQKAFSMFSIYPLIGEYLAGTAASGLYEARLGFEQFGGETHVFAPAYREDEFDEILQYAGHIIFNSPSQIRKFAQKAKQAGKSVGLRINPECSTQDGHAIYDPCAPGSRLGTTKKNFDPSLLAMIDGFHMHTLCEQNADALEVTVAALEDQFGEYLGALRWINLGGGHHITRGDYDRALLIRIIHRLRERYGVQVYLEPGEAVVLNAGFLVASVLETLHNGIDIAILDASAACHMPDVIEMPYRPPVFGSGKAGEYPYLYRLTGPTCLAGDVIGDYSFDHPLSEGEQIVFEDMALYTMVKNNTFNGMRLPSIVLRDEAGNLQIIRRFGYADFKDRLS